MKKIFSILSILALVCACNDIDPVVDPIEENGESNIIRLRLTADADGREDPDTKMTLSLNDGWYDFLWSDGDQISLINKTGESYCEPLDLTSDPGSYEGDFEGDVYKSSNGWYAVYPYAYENKIYSKDTLSLEWYGTNQKAVKDTPASDKILMVGLCSSSNPSIKFKNALAYFKFKLDFACEEVIIEPNNDTALGAASLKVVVGEDGIPVVCGWTFPHSGDASIHLKPASGEDIKPGTYFLAAIPQELADGFSMRFIDTDGTSFYKSTAKTVELKRNVILNLGEMSKSNLSTDGDFQGAGTKDNPYLISSKEQLMTLSDLVYFEKDGHYASAYYEQACDIDCGGDVLDPIGFHSISISDKPFKGTYDGKGYTISNFAPGYLKSSGGLFGGVEDATFKNIVLQPRSFSKRFYSGNTTYYGILAGFATGHVVVHNCKVVGDSKVTFRIKADFVSLGAIVGATVGSLTITNCSNSMDLTVTHLELTPSFLSTNVAGIVGRSYIVGDADQTLVFDSCRNSGNIWSGGNGQTYAGGIIGRVYEDSSVGGSAALMMTNCVNSGSVAAATNDNEADAAAGGLVGSNRSDGYSGHNPYLYNCLNKGDVTCVGNDGYGGGIMGFVFSGDTKFYLCVNTGNVTDKYGTLDLSKYDVRIGAITGDNYSSLYNPGYYYWCYWTNDANMPIVYDEPNYSHASNCGYRAAITYSEMNDLRVNVPSCGYPVAYWMQNDGGLDLALE